MEPPSKDSPYQLIVEGVDDGAFLGKFQEKMLQDGQINERAYIWNMGGIYQDRELRKYLSGLILRSTPVKAIGLIRDADQDPQAAFASITGVLKQINGVPVPSQITKFQVDTQKDLRVGVLILPHDRPGIRETLCLEAVSSAPVIQCVDDFMDCVIAQGNQPHTEDKARLLAYLAAQENTDARTGIAVERDYIPWRSPAFEIIRQFLQDLTIL
jgi:hypothetical protein